MMMMWRRITTIATLHRRIVAGKLTHPYRLSQIRTHPLLISSNNTTDNMVTVNNNKAKNSVDPVHVVKSWPNVHVTLYKYDELLPFYITLKAFLDYYGIPYTLVSLYGARRINWSSVSETASVLKVDGKLIVNSVGIIGAIDILAKKMRLELAARSVYEQWEEKNWLRWVDCELSFILVCDHTRQSLSGDVHSSTYFLIRSLSCGEKWVRILDGRDFLGGTTPNVTNFAVYGLVRSSRFREAMLEHTKIGEWYSRMESGAGMSSHI